MYCKISEFATIYRKQFNSESNKHPDVLFCSMSDDNNGDIKRYRNRQLVWLGIYMGIGLAIVFLLPFPIDIILLIGTMVGMNFIRRRWLMGKYLGGKNIGGLFGFPSSMTGNQPRPLKYYCVNCGKEHKEIACPNCGSKMKRVG
jgi:hypothetical protein